MTRTIAAIDPGRTGAIAILSERGDLIEVLDMPTNPVTVSGKIRHIVSAPLLATMLRAHDPAEIWLERVGVRPGEGAVGAFAFGRGVGAIEGVVAYLGKPLSLVTPSEWKKATRTPADKGGARARAMQLFPTCADLFKRVKDDGRAEAALIGVFACRSDR
ncbi:RuvC family protein [Acetobacter fallax]|uniref:Holliday junction resolvase RuvC n=1 Tax=Acetobacter fallax TaxID=1737473 RepID=A0ABX0KDM2_9PROT|nr:hypothetical protein [Acetobacter fallax]NHO33569.1 hypothetical protein [Acetobacter fallax]NHO37185.1 hypothetical protein [Acetobacter fallax]